MVEPALWIFSATYLYSLHINNLPLVIFTYLEIVVDVLSLYKTPNKHVCSVLFCAILYLYKSHNTPLLPPKICIIIVCNFSRDMKMS